jgi:prepilin-type N-terminal cleavage/methylation domain-containing protein
MEFTAVPSLSREKLMRALRRVGRAPDGFTLVEMMIAMFILTFGLLAVGQMIYVAVGSASLARSQGNAVVVAQDKLESLADSYRQNPNTPDLSIGRHGPVLVQVVNPTENYTLNNFRVDWVVSNVPDPRVGVVLAARQVLVTVTPIGSNTNPHLVPFLNKVVSIACIFSVRF